MIPTNYATLWVCQDCLMMAANGETAELDNSQPAPLCLLAGADYALGITEEAHASNFDHESECIRGECGCETVDFWTAPCDGCGSRLAGSRHGVTLWVTEQTPAASMRIPPAMTA